MEPQGKPGLFLQHLFLTKEGNLFTLEKCNAVRCAELRSFKEAM